MSGTEAEISDSVKELNELFNGEYFTYRPWVDDAVFRIDGYIERSKIEDTDILMDFTEVEDYGIETKLFLANEEIEILKENLNIDKQVIANDINCDVEDIKDRINYLIFKLEEAKRYLPYGEEGSEEEYAIGDTQNLLITIFNNI